MLKIHCDGCDGVVSPDEVFYTISVKYSREIQSSKDCTMEKDRTLCCRCMAKVRPGLDVVDGKTD